MNGSAPPLRFLGLVVGGWIGVRLILLYGPALQAVPSPACRFRLRSPISALRGMALTKWSAPQNEFLRATNARSVT